MADPTRRKANFLWKFLCAGTAFSAMRTPVPHRSPPARIFAEQKCLATDKVSQICCSAGRSSDILQTSKAVHTRKRVLPKYVEDCPIGKAMQIWNSRDLKRAAALLFPKESRGNPFKGSLWATSSPRLDTALLCAAKKRGVESPGWQASAS